MDSLCINFDSIRNDFKDFTILPGLDMFKIVASKIAKVALYILLTAALAVAAYLLIHLAIPAGIYVFCADMAGFGIGSAILTAAVKNTFNRLDAFEDNIYKGNQMIA